MSDELQTGTIPPRNEPEVATAANSTTLAIQLAAKKKWALASKGLAGLGSLGFTLLMVAVTVPGVAPALIYVGAVAFGLGSLGGVLTSALSGAEVTEKDIEVITERVQRLADAKLKKNEPPAP